MEIVIMEVFKFHVILQDGGKLHKADSTAGAVMMCDGAMCDGAMCDIFDASKTHIQTLVYIHTLFCSSSASANSFLILASDSPTYLSRICGPLTILGSRASNILPICLRVRK